MKRVQITLDLSESFIRALNAKVGLTGGFVPDKPLDPGGVLARVVLLEARGATEAQVHLATPPEWRGDIEAVHEARAVREVVA